MIPRQVRCCQHLLLVRPLLIFVRVAASRFAPITAPGSGPARHAARTWFVRAQTGCAFSSQILVKRSIQRYEAAKMAHTL